MLRRLRGRSLAFCFIAVFQAATRTSRAHLAADRAVELDRAQGKCARRENDQGRNEPEARAQIDKQFGHERSLKSKSSPQQKPPGDLLEP